VCRIRHALIACRRARPRPPRTGNWGRSDDRPGESGPATVDCLSVRQEPRPPRRQPADAWQVPRRGVQRPEASDPVDKSTQLRSRCRYLTDPGLLAHGRGVTAILTENGKADENGLNEARQRAADLCATVSHLSAAVHYGWKMKWPPHEVWVTVPRKRRVRAAVDAVRIHWVDLTARERSAGVTSPLRTVLDCSRVLPFDEGLAIADSALRSGMVSRSSLRLAAAQSRGPGSIAIRRVARYADGRAKNPMESVLRALALAAGLELTPQLIVAEPGFFAVADLGDTSLRLAIEADGFEHHGTRAGLRADCVRHTGYALHGWTSMRFAYEDVMYSPEWVIWVLHSWLTGDETSPPRRATAGPSEA
jgi:very-short-patch-repair endonuclease